MDVKYFRRIVKLPINKLEDILGKLVLIKTPFYINLTKLEENLNES